MKKTGSQVESDIYKLVKNSVIATAITGKVYRFATRPHESKLEDSIIIFITGLDGENQDGALSINTYIPYITFGGSLIKNVKRCNELEIICQQFVDSLPTDNYLFSLGQVISTFDEAEINQHFINIKLRFKYNTLN